MIKFLITITFLLTAALNCYSKTNSTTPASSKCIITGDTSVPVGARFLRNAMAAKDSLVIMIQERILLLKQIDNYEALEIKDSIILAQHKKNIELYDNLIELLKKQVANAEGQNGKQEKISLNLGQTIRKKNWAIVKITGISISIISGLLYLLSKK